jgi:hypothetical protein
MNSHVKKSRSPKAQRSRLHKEAGEENLDEILEHVSFKTMTLEERSGKTAISNQVRIAIFSA